MLDVQELEEQVADNLYLANILTVIATNPTAFPHFTVTETTLRYRGWVVLPAFPYSLGKAGERGLVIVMINSSLSSIVSDWNCNTRPYPSRFSVRAMLFNET